MAGWAVVGNLKGPTGAQGSQGAQGLQGVQGIQGVPGPSWPRVVKSADQANSTVNFADVSDLTFAVLANTTYVFRFVVFYTTAATTTALQLGVNGPASPAFLRYSVLTLTGATAVHNALQTAYDANTNPATGGGSTPLVAIVEGVITTGAAAGTVALRMRSEVNASAVTVLRGSHGYSA